MICLRPHHLLCCLFYEGKGYNETFIENMNLVQERLNHESIQLTLGCDAICTVCPNQIDENSCLTQDKVLALDKKVLEQFPLQTGKLYDYSTLQAIVRKRLDRSLFDSICNQCEWYNLCKNKVKN